MVKFLSRSASLIERRYAAAQTSKGSLDLLQGLNRREFG
jgi:hypothetical protein